MKITRRQLRQIIREASNQPVDPTLMRNMGYNDAMAGKYMDPKYENQIDYKMGFNEALDDIDNESDATGSMYERNEVTRKQIRKTIKETLVTEARNVSFPFTEVAEYFQDLGYKVKKAHAGEDRGAALFQLPINIQGGTKDLGYYVNVKYEYGMFYFYWYLRSIHDGRYGRKGAIRILKPGGGNPRWEAEYRPADLKVVVDEIDFEISKHDAEDIHPFDLGLPDSKFKFKG